jgi:hypothetical protein
MPLDLIAVNSLNADMTIHPAVIVHGLADARAALAVGEPVTLLSAPGAALFAGCLWWRELISLARVEYPDVVATDILDCADASGMAMGALRSGVTRLVLWPTAPGWQAVAAIAEREGGYVLPQAPEALDMAARIAPRRLRDWLRRPTPDPTATR